MLMALMLVSVVLLILIAAVAFLLWYNRLMVARQVAILDDVRYVQQLTKEFNDHLQIILGMETYTGEPIIENLVKHGHAYSADLAEFQTAYSFDSEAQPTALTEGVDEEKE